MNALTSLLGLLGVCLLGTLATGCCSSTVTSEVASPNGVLVAVSVLESCGGALGSNRTLVEVRRKGDFFSWIRPSTVLVLGCVGTPRLQWRHSHLSIGLTTALADCVIWKEYEWNGIAVSYDDLGGKHESPSFGHW
jgi:hypothetical protein